MNIDETKKKIEALPDDEKAEVVWANPGGFDDGFNCRTSDLKVLIADHTRLELRVKELEELQRVVHIGLVNTRLELEK